MRFGVDKEMTNASVDSVVSALRRTKKGQLTYDTKWKEEGRTEEIVSNVKESLVSINPLPKSLLNRLSSKSELADTGNTSNRSLSNDIAAHRHHHNRQPEQQFNSTIQSSSNITDLPMTVSSASLQSPSSRDEIELIKSYEQERREKVQEAVEKTANLLRAKYESTLQNIESEIRLIQNRFLVQSFQVQKEYDEEYNKVLKNLELEQSTAQPISAPTKDTDAKLKEIAEKKRLLEKEREKKEQQQISFRETITKCKEAIGRTVEECNAQLKQQPQVTAQLSSSNISDLQHYRTLLLGLVSDLDVLLWSTQQGQELKSENVVCALERLKESEKIKQQFFNLMSQYIAQYQPKQPAPPPAVTREPTGQPTAASYGTASTTPHPTGQSQQPAPLTSTPAAAARPAPTRTSATTNELTCEPRKIYLNSQTELIEFEEICNRFANANKDKRTQVQLTIRGRINTMCNEEISKLCGKTKKLLELLQGRRVEATKGYVQCSTNDGSLSFAINCAVKQFLNVTVKQKKMAVKLAPVIVVLWARVPHFGQIFLAQLYRSCPYAIPYFPMREQRQSEEEYMVLCGYQLNSQGQITETDEMFYERMYSLVQLYAAVTQCNMPSQHPRDLQYAWNWLARVLNDKPKPILSALLMDAFLSVSTHKLLKVYDRQFRKVIYYISTHYLKKIESVTALTDRQTLMKFKSMLAEIEQKMSTGKTPDAVWQLSADLDLVPDNFFNDRNYN